MNYYKETREDINGNALIFAVEGTTGYGAFDGRDRIISGLASQEYVETRCQLVTEEYAREIHPELFVWLEQRDLIDSSPVRASYQKCIRDASQLLDIQRSCFKTWDELEPDVQEKFRQKFLEEKSTQ